MSGGALYQIQFTGLENSTCASKPFTCALPFIYIPSVWLPDLGGARFTNDGQRFFYKTLSYKREPDFCFTYYDIFYDFLIRKFSMKFIECRGCSY